METETYYKPLTRFFKDVTSPQKLCEDLDQLLYFLTYYEYREGTQGFFEVYSDVFELKQVLQAMVKSGEPWK